MEKNLCVLLAVTAVAVATADTTIDPAAPYAYGANVGWIRFEQSEGQPKVNLETGALSGHAWSANVGWLSLDGAATLSLDSGPDTDTDGIPDAWEYGHTNTLDVLAAGGTDSDGDGVPDIDEYGADTGSSFVPPSGPEISEMVTGVPDTNRFYRVQVATPLSP